MTKPAPILTLAALLIPSIGLAGTVTLTYGAPTLNTDGTAISGPITYSIYGAKQGSAKTLIAASISALTYTHTAAVGGQTWCYEATATVATVESAHTGEVCKAVPSPVPNPPNGLTVASVTAYVPVMQNNALVMLPVGTAPAGVVCDAGRATITGGKFYYGIPKESVAWFGTVRPLSVYSTCS